MRGQTFLALSEEQQMLVSTAAEYFNQNQNVDEFRRARDSQGRVVVDAQTWQDQVDLGWGSMTVPEELDGLGFGIKGLGLLLKLAGQHLSATHLMNTGVCVAALLKTEASNLRDDFIKGLADGTHTCAVSLGIGDPVHDSSADLVAEAGNSDYVMQISAHGQLTVFALDGAEKTPHSLIDRRDYQKLKFDKLKPVLEASLREKAVAEIHAIAAILVSAELFGIAEEAFKRTLSYLNEREQFGQKIGAFQALQHRMAKIYSELELGKSVLLDALSAVEQERDDLSLAAAHAKTCANQVSQLVCTEAIQMHGGMGITDELDIGLFYKRARVLQSQYGTTAFHQQQFARHKGF